MSLNERGLDSLAKSAINLWKNRILLSPLKDARSLVVEKARQESPKRWAALTLSQNQIHESNFFEGIKRVGLFVPQDKWHEPVALPWTEASLDPSQVCYPKLHGDNLKFYVAQENDLIEDPRFQIAEPKGDTAEVVPDLIFIPALMVDMNGHRVGRGLGFYDRYLSQHRKVKTLAVVHSNYIFQSFPSEWIQPWDQKVHGFVTEKDLLILEENFEASSEGRAT